MNATRFALFSVLYAFAALLEHAQLGTQLGANRGALVLAAALVVALVPSSLVALSALLAAQGWFFAAHFPHGSNLGFLLLFVCLSAAGAWLALLVGRARDGWRPVTGAEWLDAAAPLLRAELLVLYAWATWHKLNADFFDPDLSCAVELYEKVRSGLSFLPLPAGRPLTTWLALATLATEGVLPLLLVPRRTRAFGVVFGVAFHVVLGFGYYYAFSAASIAVLFLFLPDAYFERLEPAWRRWYPWRYRVGVLVFVVAATAARLRYGWHADRTLAENLAGIDVLGNQFSRYLWWSWVPLVPLAALGLTTRGLGVGARRLLAPRHTALLVLPLAFFLNGASPYLGLKTEYSFAMYSNLRTEPGRENHFLVPAALGVGPFQRDLVTVLEAGHPALAATVRRGNPLPFLELVNRVHDARQVGARDFALVYVRDGRKLEVPSVEADPRFGRAPSALERLLRFREVRVHNACDH